MTLRRDAFPASPVNARLSRALRLRIAFTMLSCLIERKETFPKHSILLAEDNLLVIRAIKNLLESQGYRVTAVEDGIKELSYLKSYTYEWALLDLVLPETDGIDLVQNYRDWEKEMNKPHLPVFGLTGYPFKSMERICKEASESLCSRRISAIVPPKFVRMTRLKLGRDTSCVRHALTPSEFMPVPPTNDFTA